MAWGYAIGGLASLASTWMSNNASSAINAQSYHYTRELARFNQKFQKEMSNTAHQREIEDLTKAGLNPILSAGGQGASTPTATTGQFNAEGNAENYRNLANNLSNIVNEAVNNKLQTRALNQQETVNQFNNERTWQESQLLAQQTETEQQNTELRKMQILTEQREALLKDKELSYFDRKIVSEIDNQISQTLANMEMVTKTKAETKESKSRTWRNYNEPIGYFDSNVSASGGGYGINASRSTGTKVPIYGKHADKTRIETRNIR